MGMYDTKQVGEGAIMLLQTEHADNPRRLPRRDRRRPYGDRLAAIVVLITLILGGIIGVGVAAELEDDQHADRLFLTVNKSRTLRIERPFTKAIVGAPDIAEVLPTTNQTLYIQAKKIGTTNISLFDDQGRINRVIDLEVNFDTATVQQRIWASTGSRGIRVSSAGNQVILSGLAVDAVAADRALSVAKGLAPEGVVNAMQVAPSQQVMLEVRFLEATRDAGRELGVNWAAATPGPNGVVRGVTTGANNSIINGAPGSANNPNLANGAQGIPMIQTLGTLVGAGTTGPFATVLANVLRTANGTTIDALVTALETKGLVRRLAEPNLIALSGDTARFLAGGEFPVPVASTTQGGLPTVTIEWKKFGVQLAFVPTVLSRGVINLRVEPSVSELDFANAVTIQGTTIPSLITRDARTAVELRDGQSFAIAGLLQTRNLKNIQQVPWIGSVPVIGALFRSSAYQQNETDLVVIVTPRLVAPAVPGQRVASPLDSRLNGNDVDFFLNGQPETRKRYIDYVSVGGELQGPYGHIVASDSGSNGVVLRTRN
jgi:pilus assembly protein CpaC